ncbi:MAG: hypothetical protein ACI857_000650 [Arenicella sp.]|jgi:hypothetical protein
MKRILVAIFCLLFSSGAFSQILVEESSKDLGDVYEHKGEVAAQFILKNPYKEDTIHIHNINTSCGCTVILSQDTIIPPGGSIPLKFSYNPEGRSGLFTKSIEVISRIGVYDQHRLFLKLTGNVVNDNPTVKKIDSKLIEYVVAPLNYYAITPYDTSYLDFNFFISFVNDLSYEIDFYQFTTLGFQIGVRDYEYIEQFERLITYSQKKITREFRLRGYDKNTVFFETPVFIEEEIPEWAAGSIKVFSANFGSDLVDESVIKLSAPEIIENKDLMLNYQRFSKPSIDEIMAEVNFDALEGKLFMDGRLEMRGMIEGPKRMTYSEREKTAKKLEKLIYKKMKKNTGISKATFSVKFDSLGYHPENKYKFQMWSRADEEQKQTFTYEVKNDNISPPLLPTYRQSSIPYTELREETAEFKYFWKNLILNSKAGYPISLIIENSKSKKPAFQGADNWQVARQEAVELKEVLSRKFLDETGKILDIKIEAFERGPDYIEENRKHVSFSQYEYFTLIPVVHANKGVNPNKTNPYMVNFDYFFNGIDTTSWVFERFGNYLISEVENEGVVRIIMESSISQIQIEKKKANIYLAYERGFESQIRIRHFLEKKLIDPNRVIFSEERYLVQGPKYNGTIPIVKFRKFQYVKVVPEKHLKQ